MMGRLKRWWQRLVGRPQHLGRPVPPDAARKPGNPTAKRPVAPGELGIVEENTAKPKGRSGRAGFDPYSSDAGYSKPHGWDRVDHD